jgi:FkbH-like protein
MSEAIRLVIWDLDETFWKGTLTEGGIREYVKAHHDIVIELARRGIMSSICSKNDFDAAKKVLAEKHIWDYFIFPSINWEPKAARIASLVENVQMRPSTVLFIDDNPSNRAEVEALVSGIQTADDLFIAQILKNPLFAGREDFGLARLAQYKLLEEKKRDEKTSGADNEEFLRSSDVRVCIERDIEVHIDRAIELINRTNQLNFTKKRLPGSPDDARRQLRRLMAYFDCQAGLIQVADKYGDYGFVGFFATTPQRKKIVAGASNTRLVHFCFSCRTLGMLIEQWIYDHLGRPELRVMGDVLTDLSLKRKIDWVRLVDNIHGQPAEFREIASHVVVYGGCEAHIIGGYLTPYTQRIDVFGNYAANGLFCRIDRSDVLLDICRRDKRRFAAEAEILGLPAHLEAVDIFANTSPNTLFILNLSADAHDQRVVRHKIEGWVTILEPRAAPGTNFVKFGEDKLRAHLSSKSYSNEQREHLLRVSRHIRENYELGPPLSPDQKMQLTRKLIERTPKGAKIVFTVNHNEERDYPSEKTKKIPEINLYAQRLRNLVGEYSYTTVVSASEVIESIHDLREANHYARGVYFRFSQRIAQISEMLVPKAD